MDNTLQQNEIKRGNTILADDHFVTDRSAGDEDTLYVFYDLKWLPICFDISYFLMSAEIARSNMGLRRIVFVIVPAHNILRSDVNDVNAIWDPISYASWRLNHVILSHIPMFPSIASFSIARSRTEGISRRARAKHQFPDCSLSKEPYLPIKEFYYSTVIQLAKNSSKYIRPHATPEAIAVVKRWLAPRLGDRRLIVVTLRQTNPRHPRDSNLEAWMKFAEGLDPDLYFPLFIPDTYVAFTADLGIWRENCFFGAAFDLQLRMALYETAWLNFFVNNGPFSLAMLNEKCRLLCFKLFTTGTEARATDLEEYGFPVGKNPPHATRFQRLVWEDDDYPAIMREFQDMVKFIETNESSP